MAYKLEKKLVITIASSALFDLTDAHHVFVQKGEEQYRKYQLKNCDVPLSKGVAFPFIRRLLNLNKAFPKEEPVEVVLLSRNDPDTGLRVFRSIKHYGLGITRAAFLTGRSPFKYIPAFNASLFLSANKGDVRKAIKAGYPAGTVLESKIQDDENDHELRIAFDFDGVIIDDEAETVYKKSNDIILYHQSETEKASTPHKPGPLSDLFKKIAFFQKLELKRKKEDDKYQRILRTAIITARNAPSHERFVTTLRHAGVFADETFFLGGINKQRILDVMKPHIFFDDQMRHLEGGSVPSVHIPFGIANIGETD